MTLIGIDLGATSVTVGIFTNGVVETIASDLGNRSLPNYVAFTDAGHLIGKAAKDQQVDNPKNTVFDLKKLIGREFNDSRVQEGIKHWPFEVINDNGKPKISLELKGEHKAYTAEEICSMTLAKIKVTSEAYLGMPIAGAFIAVSDTFDDQQRGAMEAAGEMAGLNVLRVISEPMAGVLAYGFGKNFIGERNVLIFDLGASSCSASIVTVHISLLFQMNSIAEDLYLGGKDFDDCLANYLANEFECKYKKDIYSDTTALLRLKVAVERAKRALSTNTETTIKIEGLLEGIDFYSKVSRAQFEELCERQFINAMKLVEKALNDASMDKEQIQEIVLVGGSTRIPKLQKQLQKFFNGKSVNMFTNPDEAIARGAAIQAAILRGSGCGQIHDMLLVEAPGDRAAVNGNTEKSVKISSLVVLACKENKVKILEYLLGNHSSLLPQVEDEAGHNAFYYAIRSCNVKVLEMLINRWPGNYFATRFAELDEVLSRAYEHLKLINVFLTEEMEIFVENKLIRLRFFANDSWQSENLEFSCFDKIKERIKLVIQSINSLKVGYSNDVKIDEIFLYTAKFIAQNIHILKRQLKSTYDKLPWEEIEFCLVSFISSYLKRQEINLFYSTTLNKSKILDYLEYFAMALMAETQKIESKDIGKLAELPKIKREKAILQIKKKYVEFEKLYSDYQQIRDIHSLGKINAYVKLALSADPKEREGQLTITRALQVVGEYLKNTLESPKLSGTTSEILLLTLTKNTRQVIIDLRNSLSHAYSLCKRTEIEENPEANFFVGVQKDVQKIAKVIADMMFSYKIKTIRLLLEKIVDSKGAQEITEFVEIFMRLELSEVKVEDIDVLGFEKLKKLFEELSNNIADKTIYEQELFSKVKSIFSSAEINSDKKEHDSYIILGAFQIIGHLLINERINNNNMRPLKFYAKQTLSSISYQGTNQNVEEIVHLVKNIMQSVKSRAMNIDKLYRLFCEIIYNASLETGDLNCIEELRDKLNEKSTCIPKYELRTHSFTKEKYKDLLESRLAELKSIFKNNDLGGDVVKKLPAYKTNKNLQPIVEMLVLDIMSILGLSERNLENNIFFLDESTPLLTGKSLRNHLAHDNNLVGELLSDPSLAVILNAKKLISDNFIKNKKKIGKAVRDDPIKLKSKYEKSVNAIANQREMFLALEAGNIRRLQTCLKNGADIKARNYDLLTAAHFAARGSNLNLIKFILEQNLDINAEDVNGQSALHFAAAFGKRDNVKYLIEEAKLLVNVKDKNGKTPLHLAAGNGHKDTVLLLMSKHAKTNAKDHVGHSPLHYAIKNKQIDVAIFMLEKETHVDYNETKGGYTPLHIAAEDGLLELVNYLLKNGANLHTKTDKRLTPLHKAAHNGHLEVVNALIQKGANVNDKTINCWTPLYYAIENNHEKIAEILLTHGANVNAVEKTRGNSPLHYAARKGHEGIVNILLRKKANVNAVTVDGLTPLHLAVSINNLKMVVSLLDFGADIEAKNRNKGTPLHYAAIFGHREIADHILRNGAKIEAKDVMNQTTLHLAAVKGQKDVCELLLMRKADVEAKCSKGRTPLHLAAIHGSTDVIELLIKHKAEVNAKDYNGITPLHAAAMSGKEDAVAVLIQNKADVNTDIADLTLLEAAVFGCNNDIVKLLIQNNAKIDADDKAMNKVLFAAVDKGAKEIVETLLSNGANVNAAIDEITPLTLAINCNDREICEILIAYGADVNPQDGRPLFQAVFNGRKDIVNILLKHNARINSRDFCDSTPLHAAAQRGHKKIASTLIANGANVNAKNGIGMTPMHCAVLDGHEAVVEALIANGANVNLIADEGSPLHYAVSLGRINIVELLIRSGAVVGMKDMKNRTALELAVVHGHLNLVKLLLHSEKTDLSAKGNDDITLLHIASHGNNLDIVKYLVNEGSNINAKNAFGLKPIHIAAREGIIDTVDYFLCKGLSANELDAFNQTLLHHAALVNQLEVVKYLITKGANVNAKDQLGNTALHAAAVCGHKAVVEILLRNGAILIATNKFFLKPLNMAEDKTVFNLILLTEKLFDLVKQNGVAQLEENLKAGGCIHAKNVEGETLLHIAASNGYDSVVDTLLRLKASPNVFDSNRYSPLHYAAKCSHLQMVKKLLIHGAVYNAVCENGKTPMDMTKDRQISNLLKLIKDSFKKIKEGNAQVIKDLSKVKDIETIKAIMNARNEENKTLTVAAVHCNFRKLQQLNDISQGDISHEIDTALSLHQQGDYQKSFRILNSAYEKRKDILGADNPGTLEIQLYIATVLSSQGNYKKAQKMLEEIFEKQKEVLGSQNKYTLKTRSLIALMLHQQGRDTEAFGIFETVYQKQREILGAHHQDTQDTQINMALVLSNQGKHEEALNINKCVFEIRTRTMGEFHPLTIGAQNNIATQLANQSKCEESYQILKEVSDKNVRVLGINHADTLRTQQNIAGMLLFQKKHNEALKSLEEVLNIQKKTLQHNHADILRTQHNIGNVFFNQGKLISALKAYKECYDQRKAILGPFHKEILDIETKFKEIKIRLKLEGAEASNILKNLQQDINVATSKGDIQTVKELLESGADVNGKDVDGRTPLHYAVSNEHTDIVRLLLQNGADATQMTNKGNTPLHTATAKGRTYLVELLLQHVTREKLNDYVNATTTSSNSTALHVAAKGGSLEIVKILLKHGAVYSNQTIEGKTSFDLAKDQKIKDFLNLIDKVFSGLKSGNIDAMTTLRTFNRDEFLAATNARNNQGKTMLQVLSANGHKLMATLLLQMLKKLS